MAGDKRQRTPVDQRGPLWKEGRGRRRRRRRRRRRASIGAADDDEMPQEFVLVVPRPDARRFADGRIGVCGDDCLVGGRFVGLDGVLLAAAEGAREGEVWLHRENQNREKNKMFFFPTVPFTCHCSKPARLVLELPACSSPLCPSPLHRHIIRVCLWTPCANGGDSAAPSSRSGQCHMRRCREHTIAALPAADLVTAGEPGGGNGPPKPLRPGARRPPVRRGRQGRDPAHRAAGLLRRAHLEAGEQAALRQPQVQAGGFAGAAEAAGDASVEEEGEQGGGRCF